MLTHKTNRREYVSNKLVSVSATISLDDLVTEIHEGIMCRHLTRDEVMDFVMLLEEFIGSHQWTGKLIARLIESQEE
jgi:hypothetical protein